MNQEIIKNIKKEISFFFVKNTIPIIEGRFLLALSGGADSMVLAYFLKELNINFKIAHCNFKLRGVESDNDQKFVEDWAKKNEIEIFTTKFETSLISKKTKKSIQELARDLRYKWFGKIMMENGIDYLLTAHHLDDSIETILFHFIRGTGIKGLLGIPNINDKILRPLNSVSKKDILFAAKYLQIPFRVDSSNSKIEYSRNFIRNEVIPLIETHFPNYQKGIITTSENLYGINKLLKSNLDSCKKKFFRNVSFNILEFEFSNFFKLEDSEYLFYELMGEFGFNKTQCNEIFEASKLVSNSGKNWKSLSHELVFSKNKILIKKNIPSKDVEFYFDKSIAFKELGISIKLTKAKKKPLDFSKYGNSKIAIDFEKLKFPLQLRRWQKGDVFFPFGINGKKKLSDFFIDKKLSKFDKENALIVCSENKIVWIIGLAQDRRFALDNLTKEIMFLKKEIIKNEK